MIKKFPTVLEKLPQNLRGGGYFFDSHCSNDITEQTNVGNNQCLAVGSQTLFEHWLQHPYVIDHFTFLHQSQLSLTGNTHPSVGKTKTLQHNTDNFLELLGFFDGSCINEPAVTGLLKKMDDKMVCCIKSNFLCEN